MALSKTNKKDPTGALKWEREYTKAILKIVDKFNDDVVDAFTHMWDTGELRTLEAGKFDPTRFYPFVDKLADKKLNKPAKKTIKKVIPKAYAQGVSFGSVVLGAPYEERAESWARIATLLAQNENEFRGYSTESAKQINRIIGDGVIKEKTQGQIIDDLQKEFDMSKGRATRIIRTETMRAVNTGVDDRYEREGIRDTGHGRKPPIHPNCRCTIIVERRAGKMVKVWLAHFEPGRTCGECEDLDGTVI